MKLVAIVESVNQECNKDLIGSLVIVDSKLDHDIRYELCYNEVEHNRLEEWYHDDINWDTDKWFRAYTNLRHSVANVSIIGVL